MLARIKRQRQKDRDKAPDFFTVKSDCQNKLIEDKVSRLYSLLYFY